MKNKLREAFRSRLSSSILIIGPTDSGKEDVVRKVMREFCDEGVKKLNLVSVARINGSVHSTDDKVHSSA